MHPNISDLAVPFFLVLALVVIVCRHLSTPKQQPQRVLAKIHRPGEKGQGLVEYAAILVLAAIVVIVIMAICIGTLIVPLIAGGGIVVFWHQIVSWVTGLVDGIKAGNNAAIATALVIAVILFIVLSLLHRRR